MAARVLVVGMAGMSADATVQTPATFLWCRRRGRTAAEVWKYHSWRGGDIGQCGRGLSVVPRGVGTGGRPLASKVRGQGLAALLVLC